MKKANLWRFVIFLLIFVFLVTRLLGADVIHGLLAVAAVLSFMISLGSLMMWMEERGG